MMGQMTYPAADLHPPSAIVARAETVGAVGALSRTDVNRPVSLTAMVTAAVREVIDHPVFDSAANDSAGLDPERDDDALENQSGLADAVIAAHDTRIQVLKARIEALRTAGGASALIADLDARLYRAEAARRIALARADPGANGEAQPRNVRRSDTATAAEPPSRHLRPHLAAWATQVSFETYSRRRSLIDPRVVSTLSASMPAPFCRWSSFARPASVRATIGRPVEHRLAACRKAAFRLTAARRSLTIARRLLEGKSEQGVRPTAIPPTIAGLLRWDGSATWTLSSVHIG